MAENIVLNDVSTFANDTSAVNIINGNNTTITTAFADVLSRSGASPNQMNSSLDMNNNQIINLPPPSTISSPDRIADVVTNPTLQIPTLTTQLNFTQTGSGATTRTLDAKIKDSVYVSVTDFGATGNGSTDDTTAIQNAINSLPTSGGVVLFPVGNYKITSTLNVGNGNASTASTRMGVILQGVADPTSQPVFPGFTATSGPKITWAGGASAMITINGPLQGWGINNLYLDGSSVAGSTGIFVSSAQFGDCYNLTIVNCGSRSILLAALTLFGAFTNVDVYNNSFRNISILVPAISGHLAILLTGTASSNCRYNFFENVHIFLPGSVVSVLGIYLQVAHSNTFVNTRVAQGNASATAISFDYTIVNSFPSSNTFYNFDPFLSGGGTSFASAGSPGASAKANYVIPLNTLNGATPPTAASVPNLVVYSQGNLTGTQTNDNAITGYVGEVQNSNVSQVSAVALTTGVAANVTSITLGPGDWDVRASIGFIPAATTSITLLAGSVSQTSATNNLVAGFSYLVTNNVAWVPNSNPQINVCACERILINTPTTFFLVAQANFTVSTMGAFGRISARRNR